MGRLISERDLIGELQESYTIYGKSVVMSRAIPSLYDGLKPVQKRILYVMLRQGYNRLTKSMAISGDTLKMFHPHGEASVYGALIKLAQKWYTRVSVLTTQGNWGSSDGDPAAAARYTECSTNKTLGVYTHDMRFDVVPMISNYSGEYQEPTHLPAVLPMLLINGTQGIAVGYATSVLPHNPREVTEYAVALLQSDVEPKVSQFVRGPDFPEGGVVTVHSEAELEDTMSRVAGHYDVRAKYDVVVGGNKASEIHFTEIPFREMKHRIVEQIAGMIEEGSVAGMLKVQDLSGKQGVRVVVTTKPRFEGFVLRELMAKTRLRVRLNFNNVCLREYRPVVLSFRQIVTEFLVERKRVTNRRLSFQIQEVEKQLGRLRISFLINKMSSRLVNIVRREEEPEKTLLALTWKPFKHKNTALRDFINGKTAFTQRDAETIMGTPISRLRKSYRESSLDEMAALLKERDELEHTRESDELIKKLMVTDMLAALALIPESVQRRRTDLVLEEGSGEEKPLHNIFVSYGQVLVQHFEEDIPIQKRSGKGKTLLYNKMLPGSLFTSNERQVFHLITSRGHYRKISVRDVPYAWEKKVLNLSDCGFREGERIVTSVRPGGSGHLVMTTRLGLVKKVALAEAINGYSKRLFALRENDSLVSATLTVPGREEVLVVTGTHSLRFDTSRVRVSHCGSGGVCGIKPTPGSEVVGTISGCAETPFAMVRGDGFVRVESVRNYKLQNRGGIGLKTGFRKSQVVAVSRNVNNLVTVLSDGRAIRVDLAKVRHSSRRNRGVRLVDLGKSQVSACMVDAVETEQPVEDESQAKHGGVAAV